MCKKNTLSPPDHHLHHHHHHRRRYHNPRRSRHRHNYNQLKPARKSRTKTRKPKFLSLSKQIKTQTTPTPTPSPTSELTEMTRRHYHQQQQLNLFPLHPENQVSDDRGEDENAALLFHAEACGGGASLTGLLHSTTATTMSSEEDSLSYVYREDQDTAAAAAEAPDSLVKTAMRNRERDMSEEKWVCYSEVVEKKEAVEADQEVTSSSETTMRKGNLLSLKLDYQGILKAWSDKGSLYIQGSDQSSPQTVPDLHDHHDHFFASDNTSNLLMEYGWGNAGNLWKVPERAGSGSGLKIKEEMEGKDGWKMGQREASVLRYKEKRQSRLFAKRIRYEVRKLNAEKRPRMKGRFVKIS